MVISFFFFFFFSEWGFESINSFVSFSLFFSSFFFFLTVAIVSARARVVFLFLFFRNDVKESCFGTILPSFLY